MHKDFLKNFHVNGTALPDEIVNAILEEHNRALEAAKADTGANGGNGGKTFTQDEVNDIVSKRLAKEREKYAQQPHDEEREKALKARESRLDCREYLDSKKYPAALLEVLDTSDLDKFKTAVDTMVGKFPGVMQDHAAPPYAVHTGTRGISNDAIADAFKPNA